MAKSVYERIASAAISGRGLVRSEVIGTDTGKGYWHDGITPYREWSAQYEYDNGLVVDHNGAKWTVVREERAS